MTGVKTRVLFFVSTMMFLGSLIVAPATIHAASAIENNPDYDGSGTRWSRFGTAGPLQIYQPLGSGWVGVADTIVTFPGSTGGSADVNVALYCYLDSGYTVSCGNSATGTVSFAVTGAPVSATTTLASDFTMYASRFYRLLVSVVASGNFEFYDSNRFVVGGFASSSCVAGCGSTGAPENFSIPFRILGGEFTSIDWDALSVAPPIDFGAVQFVATSSTLFSDGTTTLEQIASQCDDSGNLFARGLCYAGSFLFVPNPSTLDDFFSIPEAASGKFPFSWIFGVRDVVQDLSASSTDNMISVDFGLNSLGIGSSTPVGNLLPTFTGFSADTITDYIGTGMWNSFQALIAAGLWLGLVVHVYHFARRLAV